MEIDSLSVLYRHPNQLINILNIIAQPTSFVDLTTIEKMRLVAHIGFCHPATNKEVQNCLEQLISSNGYWKTDVNLTLLL